MSANDNDHNPDMIDASNVPHSVFTSWAVDPDGDFVLVLEDENHKPFAMCVYTWDNWLRTYRTLLEIHDRREREPKP